jgi:hypothetical protein
MSGYFTASQRQAVPNGACETTFRIPLTIVPGGESPVWQVNTLSDDFTPGSSLPTTGGAGVLCVVVAHLRRTAAAPFPNTWDASPPPRPIISPRLFFTVWSCQVSTSCSISADTSLNAPIFSPGRTPRCRPPAFSLIITMGPSPMSITPSTDGSGGSGLGFSGGGGRSTIICELRSLANSVFFAISRYDDAVTVGAGEAGGAAGGAGIGGFVPSTSLSRACNSCASFRKLQPASAIAAIRRILNSQSFRLKNTVLSVPEPACEETRRKALAHCLHLIGIKSANPQGIGNNLRITISCKQRLLRNISRYDDAFTVGAGIGGFVSWRLNPSGIWVRLRTIAIVWNRLDGKSRGKALKSVDRYPRGSIEGRIVLGHMRTERAL